MESSKIFSDILFIEDDHGHAMLVERILTAYADEIVHVDTLLKAQKLLKARQFSLIISDLNLPDGKELQIVEKVLSLCQSSPLVVLTTSNSVTTAVEAMKLGAKDYVVKNFNSDFKELFGITLRRIGDALRLEKERLALLMQMTALRLAVNNGQDGLAVYANSGELIYANATFEEYVSSWGGSTQKIENVVSDSFSKSETIKAQIQQQHTTKNSSGFWSTEMALKEERNRVFQLAVSSLARDENLNAPGNLAMWVRDISREKQRESFQREILSTTTHDLKGPLGAIMLSAELIGSSIEKPERVKELAVRINSSAHGAVHLIDEFLSARRIQEGTFILKPALHELGAILEEVLDEFQPVAAAKNIAFSFQPSAEISAKFDKLGLIRVIGNLVSNALKFTPKGGTVTLGCTAGADDYTITIEDSGPGMEPHEAQRLFERFSRLSKHSEVAGTGLGLFVVKCIVGAHGGTIDLKSSLGKGTLFSVNLPKEPPVNAQGELISLDFG